MTGLLSALQEGISLASGVSTRTWGCVLPLIATVLRLTPRLRLPPAEALTPNMTALRFACALHRLYRLPTLAPPWIATALMAGTVMAILPEPSTVTAGPVQPEPSAFNSPLVTSQ